MIVTKAIAAIAMTGIGSLAAGTAAYLEGNPSALTHETAKVRAPPAPPLEHRVPVRVTRPAAQEVVVIEPVLITAPERRPPRALAKPVRPVEGPCSDWQGLATGPSGRKVRLLCPH
jgi:hypothetical protein